MNEEAGFNFDSVKSLLYIALILGLHFGAFAGNSDKEAAKQRVVSGKVVDAFGESIAGAKITIPETGEVFYTDFDGNFKLTLKTDKVYAVAINSLGYHPVELKSSELSSFSDLSLKAL